MTSLPPFVHQPILVHRRGERQIAPVVSTSDGNIPTKAVVVKWKKKITENWDVLNKDTVLKWNSQ